MAEQLAAVPEESMAISTRRSLYRDLIRRVVVSGTQIRSTLFSHSQFGHSGSSYSTDSASNSYPSNSSGRSSGSAAVAELGAHELRMIARRMVNDGYTQRMVEAIGYDCEPGCGVQNLFLDLRIGPPAPTIDGPYSVLDTWFLELDVPWALRIGVGHETEWLLGLLYSGSSLQFFVERWIRGLTVTVYSIVELLSIRHEITSVTRFGKASMLKMLVFVDAIIPAFKAENLRTVLDMYTWVARAMDIMEKSMVCTELVDLGLGLMPMLSVYVGMLKRAIFTTMEKMRTLIEDDDSWAIEIPRGRGEVHKNTRLIVDCMSSLGEAEVDSTSSGNNSGSLSDMILYLKDLLMRKSLLCSDPSMRYLFLLNNSYFVAQMIEPCEPGHDWKLTPECEKYMHSYLDVSWGHVLSYIPKSHFPGPLQRWINTSSLVKFESAFHKTYQAQKFWKVPDPRLRDELRRAITERVISGYRNYLGEHPELEKHIGHESSSPEVLEEMLVELFEG